MLALATGRGGSGKTKYVCRIARKALKRKDTLVFSNLPFNAPDALAEARLHYYSDVYDLARVIMPYINTVDRILIIMDEADNLIDARNWKELDSFFKWLTGQDRHFGIDMWATSRHWLKVDADFRRQAHLVIDCDVLRIFGIRCAFNTSRAAQKKGKIPRGFFVSREYDAIEYEKWSATQGTHEMVPDYVELSLIMKSDRDFFDTFAMIPFPYVICQDCGHIQTKVCLHCKQKVLKRSATENDDVPSFSVADGMSSA